MTHGAKAAAGLGAVCAAAATAIILVGPATVIVMVLAATVLAASILAPKAFAGAALVIIIFSSTIESLAPAAALAYVDEAIVVICLLMFCVRRLLASKSLRALPGLWPIMAFVGLGLGSAVVAGVPPFVALSACFLAVKGFLLGIAFVQLDWGLTDLRRFVTGGTAVALVILVASGLNLVAPGPWTAVFAPNLRLGTEFGLDAVIGPFTRPAALGRICALIAIAALAYRLTVSKGRLSAAILAFSALFGFLSFRSKTFGALLLGGLIVSLRRLRWGFIVGVIVLGPILAIVLGDWFVSFVGADVQQFLFESNSARATLADGGVSVANAHFPLGAGFGRYGSFIAASTYSPEYAALGFDGVYGLSLSGNSSYLTDTSWPAVYGETGWLGLASFIGVLGLTIAHFVRLMRSKDEALLRWLGLTGLGWVAVILVESIAAPVFTSAPSYPLIFVLAAFGVALQADSSKGALTGRYSSRRASRSIEVAIRGGEFRRSTR